MNEDKFYINELSQVRAFCLNSDKEDVYKYIYSLQQENTELKEKLSVVNQMDTGNYNKYCEALKENTDLKKQLEYLRSGEYLNQLKFENMLLEDIVQNMEVSKEDKKFIDMTHRNTELLEENEQLKEKMNCDLKWALKYDELFFENKQLKDRIEKANILIKKIKDDIYEKMAECYENEDNWNGDFLNIEINSIDRLLKILKKYNKEEIDENN